MDHMQHFKWFSAQYPNIWFLIYTISKFYKVAESLLWINSDMPEKDETEGGLRSLGGVETCLPKKSMYVLVGEEKKYSSLAMEFLKKSRKDIKGDLFWR